MALRELIGEGLQEISGTLNREGVTATISGRSFPYVLSWIDSEKSFEVDGKFFNCSAALVVRKQYLTGHTKKSLQGAIVTVDGEQLRAVRIQDNGLSFTLHCVSKDAGK